MNNNIIENSTENISNKIQNTQDTPKILNPIINIQTPEPILQQKKANITTNPLIKEKLNTQILTTSSTSFLDKQILKFNKLNENISSSFFNFLDDIYNKPNSINWPDHIIKSLNKNHYIILLVFYIILIFMIVHYITNKK